MRLPPDCSGFDPCRQSIRLQPMDADLGEHVRSGTQVIEERELQRARPGPELPHRERRHGLERRDESLQALRIEPARARANQFESERVNARKAGEFVGSHARKPFEEGGG